jgi:hypothetical protein
MTLPADSDPLLSQIASAGDSNIAAARSQSAARAAQANARVQQIKSDLPVGGYLISGAWSIFNDKDFQDFMQSLGLWSAGASSHDNDPDVRARALAAMSVLIGYGRPPLSMACTWFWKQYAEALEAQRAAFDALSADKKSACTWFGKEFAKVEKTDAPELVARSATLNGLLNAPPATPDGNGGYLGTNASQRLPTIDCNGNTVSPAPLSPYQQIVSNGQLQSFALPVEPLFIARVVSRASNTGEPDLDRACIAAWLDWWAAHPEIGPAVSQAAVRGYQPNHEDLDLDASLFDGSADRWASICLAAKQLAAPTISRATMARVRPPPSAGLSATEKVAIGGGALVIGALTWWKWATIRAAWKGLIGG